MITNSDESALTEPIRDVVKGARCPQLDANKKWTGKFASSDPNKPPIEIKDIHIHSSSHVFDPKKNYVGLIVYLQKGKNDFTLGNVRCRTGDIFIKQSDWICRNIRQRRRRGQYIHGRLFYSIFGCWKKKKLEFVGAGFSYYKSQWKYNSGTFNTINPNNNDDTYHDTDRKLNKFEEELIEKVVTRLYGNHRWLEMSPDCRTDREELLRMELSTSKKNDENCDVHLVKANDNRKFNGTVTRYYYNRGYGFIKCIEISEDIFVHYTEIMCPAPNCCFLRDGEHIEFNIVHDHKGWRATNVTSLFSYVKLDYYEHSDGNSRFQNY